MNSNAKEKPCNILIADNYPLSYIGIEKLLQNENKRYNLYHTTCQAELSNFLKSDTCDLVMLSLTRPGSNAMPILERIKLSYPNIPVIVVCIYPEELYAYRVLKLGASGYLSRESSPEELVKAIKKVLSGGVYVSMSLAEHIAEKFSKTDVDSEGIDKLSDRELQVLKLIALGLSASQISKELSLSVNTVSTYRARIMTKMDLRNSYEIIRYGIEKGLV